MSSSARLAPEAPESALKANPPPALPAKETLTALPFSYPEVAASTAAACSSPAQSAETQKKAEPDSSASITQGAQREAQVREAGRQQGESQSRAKFEEQLGRERAAIAQAVADFAQERAAYYCKIEEEAVRLALSIARKILHREAQVDPLLLMGILRVALDRMEGATAVVLAVPAQQAAVWRNFLITRMSAGELPEIVEDPTMPLEQCQLRTSMGTADLGLEVQLKEIEKGLMDLLAARPGAKR